MAADDECVNCFDLRSDHKHTADGTGYCIGEGKEDGEWVCDCEQFEGEDEE